MKCRNCSQEIKFDNAIRSPSGKAIPLNMDGNKHDCPNNPYKKIRLSPEDTQALEKIERDAQQGTLTTTDVADIKKTLIKIEEITSASLKLLQKIAGFDQASNLK